MIMKNPHFLGWSPMFHRTDSKIRVRAFCCVLPLILTSLLQRAFYHQGRDLSLSRMLELLGRIPEILFIYPKLWARKSLTLPLVSATEDELRQILIQLEMPTNGLSCRIKLVFSPR